MKGFLRNEDGYVALLFAIFIPVFLGMGLIIFDISRGNSARTDLQAAADALALAAARELDQGPDSIQRARDALDDLGLVNTVGLLTLNESLIELTSGDGLVVTFLRAIPESDDDPIDAAWIAAKAVTDQDAIRARFVHVRAQSEDLRTFFPIPTTLQRQTVPIAAEAVASRRVAVCDIPPLFICNPVETDPPNPEAFRQAFRDGDFHARLIRLVLRGGGGQALPGNFGFLQVNGSSSANALRNMFAGGVNPTCYEFETTVQTNPGSMQNLHQGFNVRFDIWRMPGGQVTPRMRPAANVRKGHIPAANICNAPDDSDPITFGGFPNNTAGEDPLPGGASFIGAGADWDIDTYFELNYGFLPQQAWLDDMTSFDGLHPSRYDVYRWEIERTEDGTFDYLGAENVTMPTSPPNRLEVGNPMCWAQSDNLDDLDRNRGLGDRRLLVAAVVDCMAASEEGLSGQTALQAHSFVSLFLVRPMPVPSAGEESRIDAEIVDVTGGGLDEGPLEDFLRVESVLIR